jgi:serine protease Do
MASPRPLLAGLVAALAFPASALAKDPPDPKSEALAFALAVEESLVRSIAAVQESSVTVFSLRKNDQGELVPVSGGSGVILVRRGKPYVLTNEHVIQGAEGIEIRTFDGQALAATLLDHVPRYDIALLEFPKAPKKAKGAKTGKSETLSEGQWVLATGNPFFLASDGRPVATLGVISGLDRILPGEFNYPNAIQHDAEVNPGNSGGPLWNLDGELVGINGKIAMRGGGSSFGPSNTGASFSIPIHLVQVYLKTLLDERVEAAAGYAGLTLESAVDEKGTPIGAKVKRIASDCPCRKKGPDPREPGLVKDDVLVKLTIVGSGKENDLRTASDFENVIATVAAGVKIKIVFLRGKKRLSWTGELTAAKR